MREAALPAGKQGGKQPQLCSSLGLGCACLGRRRCWGVPGREQSRRGDRDSHVAQLRLPAHQDLPDPLDPEELSLDVIDGGGGVGHGHDLILWKRNGSHLRQQETSRDLRAALGTAALPLLPAPVPGQSPAFPGVSPSPNSRRPRELETAGGKSGMSLSFSRATSSTES